MFSQQSVSDLVHHSAASAYPAAHRHPGALGPVRVRASARHSVRHDSHGGGAATGPRHGEDVLASLAAPLSPALRPHAAQQVRNIRVVPGELQRVDFPSRHSLPPPKSTDVPFNWGGWLAQPYQFDHGDFTLGWQLVTRVLESERVGLAEVTKLAELPAVAQVRLRRYRFSLL